MRGNSGCEEFWLVGVRLSSPSVVGAKVCRVIKSRSQKKRWHVFAICAARFSSLQIARAEARTSSQSTSSVSASASSQHTTSPTPPQHASETEWGAVFALIGPTVNETGQSAASSWNASETPAYSFSNGSFSSDSDVGDSGGYYWNSSEVNFIVVQVVVVFFVVVVQVKRLLVLLGVAVVVMVV